MSPKHPKRAKTSPGRKAEHPGKHAGPAIRCTYTRLVDPATLRPNPANPNKHPADQLALLVKVIQAQGWRRAPVVSRQSGLLVTGHGAVQAAIRAGWREVPVDDQNFDSPEDETAHMLADNQLAELAELDQKQVEALLADLGEKDFPLDLTGFDLASLSDETGEDPADHSDSISEKFEVVVECESEDQQQEVFERLTGDGHKCRLLTL